MFEWHAGRVALGDRAREGRLQLMWSKSRLAERMRQLGFKTWQEETVRLIEAGERRPAFDELVALTWIFSEQDQGFR